MASDAGRERWMVGYSGGPYGGVAWLQVADGELSLHPTVLPRGGGVPPPPGAPMTERPMVHQGSVVSVVHAHWSRAGAVHVRAPARTYVAMLSSWRTIEREVIPALHAVGLEIAVHDTRLGYGGEIAAARRNSG